MGTLKASVSLTSSDLFPNPLSISLTANESIGTGTNFYGSFRTLQIGASQTRNIFTANAAQGVSGVVYMYVAADTANTDKLSLQIGYSSTYVNAIRLIPGDFAYFPLDLSAARTARVENLSSTQSAVLYYFFARKD